MYCVWGDEEELMDLDLNTQNVIAKEQPEAAVGEVGVGDFSKDNGWSSGKIWALSEAPQIHKSMTNS